MVGRVRLLTVGATPGLFDMVQHIPGVSDELAVTTATSFHDALFSISTRSYDLAIATFHLSDLEGIALERADRALFGDSLSVLSTGSESDDQMVEATALGAVPCRCGANGPTRWHDGLSEVAERAIRRANPWNPSENDWLPHPPLSVGPPIGPGRIEDSRSLNPSKTGERRRIITSTSTIDNDGEPASLVTIQKTGMQSSSDGLGED